MNTYPYSNPNNNQFLQNLILQQAQGQTQEVIKVNGENGVDAFQMGANCSALLLDISAPIVWLVQTDGAGYKSKTPYDITPHASEEEVQYKSLEDRITRLEEVIDAKSNVEPITRESESRQYNDASHRSHDERRISSSIYAESGKD